MTLEQAIIEGAFTVIPGRETNGALEYDGFREEILASKTTAHLGAALNGHTPTFEVSGPDALEFLRSICVNSFRNFAVGQLRHAILCNDEGKIITDGVVIHVEEGVYRTFWLSPVIQYRLSQTDLDVQGVDLTGTVFLFQISGPRSLEILEQAAQEDLHDIRFARHRVSRIAGAEVRIVRLSMAGGLGYEVHGDWVDAEAVYRAIWQAGAPFGIRKLGLQSYLMQHTEAGFPNINLHYPLPWFETPGLAQYIAERPALGMYNRSRELVGSVDDLDAHFVSPFTIGLGKMVDFGHEFVGREALLKESEADDRAAVTLVWNDEDVAEVYRSQFRGRDVEPFDPIADRPNDRYFNLNGRSGFVYHADWVLGEDGSHIGTSTGRLHSVYYRRMISLGFIDKAHSEAGTEVRVLWGRPGTPQITVRATVERMPYYDLPNNNRIDVEAIPHPTFV